MARSTPDRVGPALVLGQVKEGELNAFVGEKLFKLFLAFIFLALVYVVNCTGSRWFSADFSRHAPLSSVEGTRVRVGQLPQELGGRQGLL